MFAPTHLPADVTQTALLEQIHALNQRPGVHGIPLQSPLPAQIDSAVIAAALDLAKDVDGQHPVNLGRLTRGCPQTKWQGT